MTDKEFWKTIQESCWFTVVLCVSL